MAEIVEEMQERLLPEYEQMQKFHICTDEQLRDCINKRKQFQTRITRSKKSMRDYLDFIIFERKIHKWVCEKEEVLRKQLSGLKASIAKRIIKLYREGLRSFPHEERLWQNFIHFTKKSAPYEVGSIYEKMLTYYSDKEHVWCDAGLWSYQYNGNMPKVKEIFYRALVRHPKSEVIHKAFFDILLAEASKMNSERNLESNTQSEQDIGLEFVFLAFSNSRRNINNINFYLTLLERCEESEYADITKSLQKQIVDYLMETYAQEEMLWHALAQRELRGFSTTDLRNESEIGWQYRSEKQKIELCSKVYETAIETLKTEKMINLYIEAMLKLNQGSSSELPLKRKRLGVAFKSGYETSCISDEHLEAYVTMLLAAPTGLEAAKRVLEKIASVRTSLKFYDLWLEIFLIEKNEEKIDEVLQKAHKALGVDSIPIWRKVIRFYKSAENHKKVNNLYKEASHQPSAEFGCFRAEYLEHCLTTSNMKETLNIYKELQQLPPLCLPLHQKMLQLEKQANSNDIVKLRLYHENIVHLFGQNNIDVWLEYIKFELQHGDPKNISLLHNRAKSAMSSDLVDDFITEYTLLNSSNVN